MRERNVFEKGELSSYMKRKKRRVAHACMHLRCTAVRAGRSRASGRRERAAPSRTRLMGTAASPNFEAEMNSHPKGAVSGGKTSVLPKRPTMPPTVIPRTEGMKICRNNLRIRRGKANSELRMRPRTLRSLDAELSEDANGSSPIPLIEVSNGLPIGRQVEAKIPLSSTPWPELKQANGERRFEGMWMTPHTPHLESALRFGCPGVVCHRLCSRGGWG
eukprot:scaffold23183_cov31-Tisochrysis_lutea.AAC.1